jgi:hypothetical protein
MKAIANKQRIRTLMAALVAVLAAVVFSAGTNSEANASTTPQMTTCQDNQKCIIYPKEGWNKIRSDKASGGTYHVTRSATKPAVYFTTGPEIDLVTDTGPKRGTAKIFVFNVATGEKVKVVKFNLKTERSHHKVVKRITGLREDTFYVAAMVSANGKPVVVDAFKSILPETSPPDGVVPPPPPEGVTPPGS